MTSLERRREARYQRRKAARERKKTEKYASNDEFANICSYKSLYLANKKSKRNVCWKASVQRYQMNLLRNLEETRAKLEKGQSITKGFVEFDTIERGKLRHIRSVHYSERVVQRSVCDNVLVPMLRRSLVYDNGACLKGKGVDRSINRLTAHLQQFYRANGFDNDGWAVLFDFSGYFDNILHSQCFEMYARAFSDQKILSLLRGFILPFGYAFGESNRQRVKPEVGAGYTGKSLGLGSQISQITAVSYPNGLDHYIKQNLRVRWYGRYMDDGYMLFRSKAEAKEAIAKITSVCERLGIKINKRKTMIVKIKRGFKFLKVRHFLTETGKVVRKMCRESITRQRQRLKKFAKMIAQGKMDVKDAVMAYASWKGYALHRGGAAPVCVLDKLFRELFDVEPPRCKLKRTGGRKPCRNKKCRNKK